MSLRCFTMVNTHPGTRPAVPGGMLLYFIRFIQTRARFHNREPSHQGFYQRQGSSADAFPDACADPGAHAGADQRSENRG